MGTLLGYLIGGVKILAVLVLFLVAVLIAVKSRKQVNESSAVPQKEENENGWFTKYLWSIVISIVGVTVFFWSLYAPELRPSQMGELGSRYWLQILMLWGTIAILIRLNAEKELAKTLQGVLAIAALMLLVAFPTWSRISGGSKPSDTGSAQVPQKDLAQIFQENLPAAFNPDGTLTDTTKWPQLVLPADGESERIRVPLKKRVVLSGKKFRVHCVYRDEPEIDFGEEEDPCPEGDMPFVYVTNESEETNIIRYAYVPI